MISLRPIDAQNWYTCCHLELSEQQSSYMEPNAISLLQALYEPTLRPRAIYEDETMVGFLMYNTELEELDAWWIYRIMIDHAHQSKGIGRQATGLMLEEIGEGNETGTTRLIFFESNRLTGKYSHDIFISN